jgi:hypothetical protein
MYDLIIGKQTMHDLGVKLDFQEKTITIDQIAQEPISTHSATKCIVEILDAKYEKADLPAIIR